MATPRICSIPDCGKPHCARGWCKMHWQFWSRNGTPKAKRTAWREPEKFLKNIALAYAGDDCLEWPFSIVGGGYGQIWRDGRLQIVSRVVCELVNGPPPAPEYQAAHSCGRAGCVSPRHLTWKTRTENEADKLVHGTHNRGDRHYSRRATV